MEPITLLQNKNIVLGVSGGIACFKSVDLASKLTQTGAHVDCVLTESATKFIAPLTFAAVTGHPAFTDADLWRADLHVPHVGLGHNADLIIIAPATVNTIAKLAHGLSDNLLMVSVMAASCPIVIAPAMDAGMWSHAATQANVDTLRARGVYIVGPAEGRMASGLSGPGRMLEPAELLGWIRVVLGQREALYGRKVVVTAGGTREPIDPVRFVSNRSSGKQGYALAQAAIDRGAQVTLISATDALTEPVGAQMVHIDTVEQMYDAVLAACVDADALLMAAAVSDFKPDTVADQKIKKTKETINLDLHLARTPDILLAVKQQREQTGRPTVVVGFAAETQSLLENARAKLESKGLDLIVANDVSASDAGFAVDTNRVTLLDAKDKVETLPVMSKSKVAEKVIDQVVALLS